VDSRGFANTGSVMGWYAMSSYLLDADVVINVPKIKVHRRGINTVALKNWVGSTLGRTHTVTNYWLRVDHHIYGATDYQMAFGCDTLWRDVGDLQRAQLYWEAGIVNPTPQRGYLVVIDGIDGVERTIAAPEPTDVVHLGAIVASVDPVAADCVASRLMGYDWRPKLVGGQWKGGIPLINNQTGASPGHALGTNDAGEIRLMGDSIGPEPNYVFDFDDNDWDPSHQWLDWDATTMTDFAPPSIVDASLTPEAGQMSVSATVVGAVVVYAYYGHHESGASYVLGLQLEPGSDVWSGQLPAEVHNVTLIAQDANLNTSPSVSASYWPGDLDDDGDVDSDDYAVFAACMAGPEIATPPAGCDPGKFDAADLNADDDVDVMDFAAFAVVFTG
jgi:hypothetical protein